MKTVKILFNFLVCLFIAGIAGASPAVAIGVGVLAPPALNFLRASMGPGLAFFTVVPVTFDGKQATEGVILPGFELPALTMFFTLVPGIVGKEQVVYQPRLSKVTKKDLGCGTGAGTKSLALSERFWNPVPLKIWIQTCADTLEGTFFQWGMKKGLQRRDLTQTDFDDYIMEILPEAINEDAVRMAWFNDTAVDTFANGGTLTNASDVEYYNAFDGIWKQVFAAVVATTTRKVTISENAQATYDLQLALASNKAYTTFKSMLTGRTDARLKNNKEKVIICTTTLFENWLDYKESQSFDRSFERQEKGFQTDNYRGVTIIANDLWDRFIQADFDNGTTYYLPHRALLTTKQNLQIALDTTNVTELDVWYEKKEELTNYKGGYRADAAVVHKFMVVAAY